MCIGILSACLLLVQQISIWFQRRSEALDSPGTGITGGFEPPCGCWKLKPSPLQKSQRNTGTDVTPLKPQSLPSFNKAIPSNLSQTVPSTGGRVFKHEPIRAITQAPTSRNPSSRTRKVIFSSSSSLCQFCHFQDERKRQCSHHCP